MKYRKLDQDGDMVFGSGKYSYLMEANAVAQAILTTIKLLKAEWWEDVESGTPLFEQMLSQHLSAEGINALDIIIKERLLKVDGVISIKTYKSEVDRSNRSYTATLTVETAYGDIANFTINL